jgi:hypothetical protein
MVLEFVCVIGVIGKPWASWILIEFVSQFSELRCGRNWFLSGFCYWKFKQIANLGFGRKNQLSSQMCSHCPNLGIFNSENGEK